MHYWYKMHQYTFLLLTLQSFLVDQQKYIQGLDKQSLLLTLNIFHTLF